MEIFNEKKFTVQEAAVLTKMSESWWRRAIFEKRVRVVKIGRKVFLPLSTIESIYSVEEAQYGGI
ncbi:MAG: hypothetical protein ACD_75C01456G0003 [uncultured bacterium]|nr:MAG: hypothetical protein ACD_75C01456G0003 [uncultured bacterium]HBG18826.1 hypothetical protein [Desulfobulbaceae bacterium]